MNLKNSKRNKSYRVNNNNIKKNNIIKQNPLITNNNTNHSKNNTSYNKHSIQTNLNSFKNMSITYKNQNNNNFKNKTSSNNIKSNPSQIIKYNQFLMINNNKNNIKNHKSNKTYDLNIIGAQKNLKIFSNNKNIMYNLKKMAQFSNHSPMGIEYNNGLGSKFNLFKSGISSPTHNSNKQKNNRHFNKFPTFSRISMNQTTNFIEYKKFLMSNSIENNIHLKSLSPKAISSNITINNEKKANLGLNKINFNKINNNYSNFKIQNINSKIKIPIRHNKNSISYSNSNYNINFNNLIFYGPNTPTSFIDDIKYNIMNNNNSNQN